MYKWLHATVIEELNIFINYILEYRNEEGASRPGNRSIIYFHT
jgi:hypothetical protein